MTQLLDEDTPSPTALAEKFNSLLVALTSHFTPLDTSLADLDHNLDVPREFLVDVSSCSWTVKLFFSKQSLSLKMLHECTLKLND